MGPLQTQLLRVELEVISQEKNSLLSRIRELKSYYQMQFSVFCGGESYPSTYNKQDQGFLSLTDRANENLKVDMKYKENKWIDDNVT